MQNFQDIQRTRFDISGNDFSGDYSCTHRFGYSLGNSKITNTTSFLVIYVVRVVWSNGTAVVFESEAVNEFPRSKNKPSLDFLVELAKEITPKMVEMFVSHPDSAQLNLQEEPVSFTTEDLRKIEMALENFKP